MRRGIYCYRIGHEGGDEGNTVIWIGHEGGDIGNTVTGLDIIVEMGKMLLLDRT